MSPSSLLHLIAIYIPLSIIGGWRWTYWIVRKVLASRYRPSKHSWPAGKPRLSTSIVTPVYNEDPKIFDAAMRSWIGNGVNEIIAVVDKSNVRQIVDYQRRYGTRSDVRCRLIVTPKPGKRAALCDGIAVAKGQLIALVDSDTIWDKGLLKKTLPYFLDRQIGGATVGQRIQNPDTVANVMFDILLWTRYREEVPFLLAAGKVFNTLSGRTAIYRREALLNPDYDNLHYLRHEHFLGTRGISGDDKRLTHLILQQGWHLTFVRGAWVYTPGLNSIKRFLKQRLRWTRNSWRADLRAIKQRWVWRHPALAYFMIDRFIQPFFMLLGPLVFVFAIAGRHWLVAGILLAWWCLSRFVRLFSYFRSYPKRIRYLPAWVVYSYVNALIKIYALATLLEHNWATRWHSARLKTKKLLRRSLTPAIGLTFVVLLLVVLYQIVNNVYQASGGDVKALKTVDITQFSSEIDSSSLASSGPAIPKDAVFPSGVKKYTVQKGDNLTILAARFQTTVAELKRLNGLQRPNDLEIGQTITYFGRSQ